MIALPNGELFPRTGPSIARGKSKQDYETPADFIRAVERRFGPLVWDLAAREDNAKAPYFITPEQDSLTVDWGTLVPRGNRFLNPEFAQIAPWAEQCAATTLVPPLDRILLLVPASVGSVWFAEHVHEQAFVLALKGRLTFVGQEDPYPKDCILAVYGGFTGFDVWDWREDAR